MAGIIQKKNGSPFLLANAYLEPGVYWIKAIKTTVIANRFYSLGMESKLCFLEISSGFQSGFQNQTR